MGKRYKKHAEKARARNARLSGYSREQVVKAGVAVVQHYSTPKQTQFLAESLHSGKLSPARLRGALEDNAPVEIHKGANKIINKGKQVTVDLLLDEYNKDVVFQNLAAEAGLDRQWFTNLAERETANRQRVVLKEETQTEPATVVEPVMIAEPATVIVGNKKTGMSLFNKIVNRKMRKTTDGDKTG
jgi:hypothetical protein